MCNCGYIVAAVWVHKLQSDCLLFIHKGCHERVIPVYTLTFCITKPVGKKVKMVIYTELAPTPIQSSSRNVHYKDEALKPLWALLYPVHCTLHTAHFTMKTAHCLLHFYTTHCTLHTLYSTLKTENLTMPTTNCTLVYAVYILVNISPAATRMLKTAKALNNEHWKSLNRGLYTASEHYTLYIKNRLHTTKETPHWR